MRIEIVRNFLTPEEITALNSWVNEGVTNKWLDLGITNYRFTTDKRLTSRLYGQRFVHPKIVLDVSDRIRKFLGIDKYPLIENHGRDGVVVSYTIQGGDVFKHTDPRRDDGLATLRCNVLTQKAESGGVLYVEGQQVNIEVGDLHCYLVSEHEHWATEVQGNTPRIMWMFGAHVPAEEWNNGTIEVNNGLS